MRNDADSMLTAALLTDQAESTESLSKATFSLDAPRAIALLEKAAQIFPDDTDIVWARLQICLIQSRCGASELSARMQKMEPDNAAAMLEDIELAQRTGIPADVDQALARAASAQRYDDHIFHIQHRIYKALQSVPVSAAPGDSPQLTRVTYAITPVFFPPVGGLFKACLRSGPISQTRKSNCASIGRLMERGASSLAVEMGNSLVMHTSDDPAERAATAERRRESRWRNEQMSRLSIQNPATSQSFVKAFLTQPTEPAMRDAFLLSNGVALQPPPGWRP